MKPANQEGSGETRDLFQRLFDAQEKIGVLSKDKNNPFYDHKYTDINSVIEMLKPILRDEKLLVLQPLTNVDGRPAITTRIQYEDEVFETTITLPDLDNPQKFGSAVTYYRRYMLMALFFIQAEDDDGNSAIPAAKKTPAKDPAPAANTQQEPTVKDNKSRVDEANKSEEEIPTCSICKNPMKPTKPGSTKKFYCKHGDQWGKEVYKNQKKVT